MTRKGHIDSEQARSIIKLKTKTEATIKTKGAETQSSKVLGYCLERGGAHCAFSFFFLLLHLRTSAAASSRTAQTESRIPP